MVDISHGRRHPHHKLESVRDLKQRATTVDDRRRRRWAIDTLAVLSFFTVVGALNEWVVVGMTIEEVAMTRLAAIPILLISGAVYGFWRDFFHRATSFDCFGRFGQAVIDTVICLSFRVPIYGMILVVGGASGLPLIYGILSGSVIIAFSGRPCGLWMDSLRRAFKCNPPKAI